MRKKLSNDGTLHAEQDWHSQYTLVMTVLLTFSARNLGPAGSWLG